MPEHWLFQRHQAHQRQPGYNEADGPWFYDDGWLVAALLPKPKPDPRPEPPSAPLPYCRDDLLPLLDL